tara:strand:- start:964 stop:3096 length:2133 start_codon:yes stop_codon:yes gene_type:complete
MANQMKCHKYYIVFLALCFNININATSYNSFGQTGLINTPSAEVHEEQSIFLVLNRNNYTKLGSITVTPFSWMEASYFYYRPDDLFWGSTKGLYLDKGFNVKFSYKPSSKLLPTFALGLDDFAGTGQFTREFVASTYNFNNIKFTSGIGWGKYVSDKRIKNPLSILNEAFKTRSSGSANYNVGGSLSSDLWFRGPASLFGGIEISIPKIKNITLKIESDPFDYFQFGCCGEGLSQESFDKRVKDSDINYGLSFKYKNFGNIDFSYIKGNSWNLTFAIGFSSKKTLRKKNKFKPRIVNNEFNQGKKNEFYYDILDNLNKNRLYLQTASLQKEALSITIDSEEHFNPIIYSSRAAYIAKKVSEFNDIKVSTINIGHINRGAQINKINYLVSDLNLNDRYPDVLIKRNSQVIDSEPHDFNSHEFKPKVNFPIYLFNISPDIRSHVGSPEKFLYVGLGAKLTTEIQLNRNLVIYSIIGKSFYDNFDRKISTPNTLLDPVRTQVVDYLQQTSDDFFIRNLELEYIWSPHNNFFAKMSAGYLEDMYGGLAAELLYKPFYKNIAVSLEYNKVKKRSYDQKFSFQDYEISTHHLNFAYYEPKTNILAKWSYGNYLAGDIGYTLDLSRRAASGWRAGFFFSQTNISALQFGEGSFDKGFYFYIPMNIFSKKYSRTVNGFSMRTMTRDGAQKLVLRNRLIDSFYGSSFHEINENWNTFLD